MPPACKTASYDVLAQCGITVAGTLQQCVLRCPVLYHVHIALCCAVLTMLVPARLDQGLGQSIGMRDLFMSCRHVHAPAGMGLGGYCSTSNALSTAGQTRRHQSWDFTHVLL
jgi:hypothetical protein